MPPRGRTSRAPRRDPLRAWSPARRLAPPGQREGVMNEADGGSRPRGTTRAAVIGYGADAREHALRLSVIGWHVDVVVRPGGISWIHAVADGLRPVPPAEAAMRADVVAVHLPEPSSRPCGPTASRRISRRAPSSSSRTAARSTRVDRSRPAARRRPRHAVRGARAPSASVASPSSAMPRATRSSGPGLCARGLRLYARSRRRPSTPR